MFLGDSIRFISSSRSYIQIPLNATKSKSTITFEMSFSTTSTAGSNTYWQNPPLIGNATPAVNSKDFGVCIRYGKLYFWAGTPSVDRGWETNATINDGAIHHVALVVNNGSVDLYCDGNNILHLDINFIMSDSTPTYIARNAPDASNYADFDLYELRIWDKALSQSELSSDISGAESDLIAWYEPRYDDGYLIDNTANAYNATLYKCPILVNAYTDLLGQSWSVFGNLVAVGNKFIISSDSCIFGSLTGGHDFTVDCWAYCSELTGDWGAIFNIFKEFNTEVDRLATSSFFSNDESCVYINHSRTMTGKSLVGVLRHYAAVYKHSTGTTYFFVDGKKVLETAHSFSGAYYVSFGLSGDGATTNFRGYFEQPRLANIARWTDDFDPEANGVADILRVVQESLDPGISENGTADILRVVLANAEVEAGYTDILRTSHLIESGIADIDREVTDHQSESGSVDILSRVQEINSSEADMNRAIFLYENTAVDVSRIVAFDGHYETRVDVLRQSAVYTEGMVDKDRVVTDGVPEDGACDILRFVYNGEAKHTDIERIVVKNETGKADLEIETVMHQDGAADTLRDITMANVSAADTLRVIPMQITTDTAGKQYLSDFPIISVEVSLQANTLSDSVRFQIARMNTEGLLPKQSLVGNLLDYNINMDIESTEHEEITQTLNSMYKVDKVLFTTYKYPQLGNAPASYHVQRIAAAMGLTPVLQFQDFTPENNFGGNNVTYQNVLSSLFGWTKDLPWRNVNVFIRDGNLYVIQRGYENNSFNISTIPHSRPQVNRSIMREYEGITVTEGATGVGTKTGNVNMKFTGYIYNGNYRATYLNGLCTEWIEGGVKTRNEYDPNTEQLVRSVVTQPDGSTTTTEYSYGYSQTGQVVETTEKQTTIDADGNRDVKTTYHTTLGNGATSSAVFAGTVYIGGSKGYGAITGTPTDYLARQANIALGAKPKRTGDKVWENQWPIKDTAIIEQIFAEVQYYDRRIEERINVDLIPSVSRGVNSMTHIIDFKDRVILDGVEYYLNSNTARQTPHEFRQSLELVRWF